MQDSPKHLLRSNGLFLLILLIFSALIFFPIFLPRNHAFIKTISVLTRYNNTRFLPVAGLFLLGALSIKNQRLSTAATTLVIFPVFALALNGLWAGAYSENNVIAGLLPRTDALSFYASAVSLKEVGYLISYTKRRPLFGSFLAFLLWISGGNLQFSLALLTFLLAAVTLFSILEMRRLLNPPAAVLYFIVLFLFIRRYIGITMSENMGLLLGISSFTLFLQFLQTNRDDSKKQKTLFLGSVFLFTLAQAARPGAIGTLPFFVLFAGWAFREEKKWSWHWTAFTTAVILAGFLLNSGVFYLTTVPGGSQANNIGFGIYGLAVGGKGWEQIFVDHPELDQFSGKQYEQAVFRFIWDEISANPFNFVKGMWVQVRTLFSFATANSFFSFMWSKNRIFSYALIAVSFILSLTGIFISIIKKNKPIRIILLLFSLGFLVSLFVAPAYQTRHMRVYAASLPFFGFLPAAGVFFLTELLPTKIKRSVVLAHNEKNTPPPCPSHLSFGLAAVVLISPILTRLVSTSDLPAAHSCDEDDQPAVIAYYPGSSIEIFRNDPSITTWVPIITQLDYKGSIHNICCDDEILYFENIPAPNVMIPTVNLLTEKLMYMVVDKAMLPGEFGHLAVCGQIENVLKERSDSGFLYPSSIQLVD